MELFSTAGDVVNATLVFLFGALFSVAICRHFGIKKERSLFLYIWHSIFCLLYIGYVLNYGGDAIRYYRLSLDNNIDFTLGTAGVKYITAFFSSVLGLSLLGTFFAFNVFGFIGLLAFDASLRRATWNKSKSVQRLATLIILLPSVSFWSSAIGKDAISFMATGLALWAALNLARRKSFMLMAIISMLIVRPHMAGIMMIGLAGAFVFQRGLPLSQRIFFGGIALAACTVMIPLALNYSGVGEDANTAELVNYIEERQQSNMQGGGSVDIASMTPPAQLFTYLFRPLPIEARSVFTLAASLDNMILLFLFIVGGREILRRRKQIREGNRTFIWLYSLLAWAILAVTTANLGISVRQKWMFAPMLIFLFISVIGKPKKTPAPAAALNLSHND